MLRNHFQGLLRKWNYKQRHLFKVSFRQRWADKASGYRSCAVQVLRVNVNKDFSIEILNTSRETFYVGLKLCIWISSFKIKDNFLESKWVHKNTSAPSTMIEISRSRSVYPDCRLLYFFANIVRQNFFSVVGGLSNCYLTLAEVEHLNTCRIRRTYFDYCRSY